jgi:ascorbate-specific PTS system EIIC-type component UlaA
MTERLVTVAVFVSPHEAGMAKGELEACGIPAFVADEFAIGANPLYSNALGGIKVQVPAQFVEEARQILSLEPPLEAADELKASDNPHKLMAKSFVWLYLIVGAAMTAVLVYIFLKS